MPIQTPTIETQTIQIGSRSKGYKVEVSDMDKFGGRATKQGWVKSKEGKWLTATGEDASKQKGVPSQQPHTELGGVATGVTVQSPAVIKSPSTPVPALIPLDWMTGPALLYPGWVVPSIDTGAVIVGRAEPGVIVQYPLEATGRRGVIVARRRRDRGRDIEGDQQYVDEVQDIHRHRLTYCYFDAPPVGLPSPGAVVRIF